ncbi:ACP phosphodiesterase [Halioxenophilus sp. WMMB6]|uniref:acyl carrier protein phosphodiesterase n=1 Tax=Halioxenophilus sp. WMMB6 TaxID=3073815 RepID=UPI00295EC381|nr:ACP phosphodiesterase [Halioxenophilus sp. WMMB6]
MNYLAHILLAGDSGGLQVGGVLGDFVKGPLRGRLPLAVEQGIWLHRQLDAWSNQQPGFRQAQARLGEQHRRIAGVLVDLVLDHFLARHWARVHPTPLAQFTRSYYQTMASFNECLPANAQRWLAISSEIDLLASYRHFAELQIILSRMESRRARPLGLAAGFTGLERSYVELAEDFEGILPQMLAEAGRLRQQLPESFAASAE